MIEIINLLHEVAARAHTHTRKQRGHPMIRFDYGSGVLGLNQRNHTEPHNDWMDSIFSFYGALENFSLFLKYFLFFAESVL